MKTTRLKQDNCTACGMCCTAATSYEGAIPEPGDPSICLGCGHIMVLSVDLRLRDPTDAECWELAGDKDILAAQRARGEMLKQMRKPVRYTNRS